MKYYLYISDTKVDMLLPQISDAQKKKVAIEYGINLKVFSAKRKVEQEENENRIVRLEAVVSFIREFGNLGTIEKPDEYIEDNAPMYSTILRDKAAYFTTTGSGAVIGIGGSVHHLIGAKLPREPEGIQSFTAALLWGLENELKHLNDPPAEAGISGVFGYAEFLGKNRNKYPTENLRFMAKRLISRGNVILATPLYVAKDDLSFRFDDTFTRCLRLHGSVGCSM